MHSSIALQTTCKPSYGTLPMDPCESGAEALTGGACVQESLPAECTAVVPAYPQPPPVAKVHPFCAINSGSKHHALRMLMATCHTFDAKRHL